MNKIIYFFLLSLIFIQSEAILKKRNKIKDGCEKPVALLNWGYNLAISLKDIQRDAQGVAKSATASLGYTEPFDKWCVLADERIQHIDSGLYLNVHGPGMVCWAKDACEWAAQVDGYCAEGTAWKWHKILLGTGYYTLGAMDRVLTAFPSGELNLRPISENGASIYQQWTLFPQ